jgi:hypothetical protein
MTTSVLVVVDVLELDACGSTAQPLESSRYRELEPLSPQVLAKR